MLLLDDDLDSISLDNENKRVVVVSHRSIVRDRVAQVLRTSGFETVDCIDIDFNAINKHPVDLNGVIGVVVDVELEQNVKDIARNIYSTVPKNAWCCIVGDSDSILLVQRFAEEKLFYFNVQYQLDLMIQTILAGAKVEVSGRQSINVAVIGCKGGIGASSLAAKIAHRIISLKKTPLLLAQNHRGTHDIDVLFDEKVTTGEVTQFKHNFSLIMGDPFKQLTTENLAKYNFVIYDHPVFNATADELSMYFNNVNTFVCVIDRGLSSLRVARRFLEECERVRATTGRLLRTFICVVDHSLEYSTAMTQGDLELLLKHQVDAVIPFLKKTNVKLVTLLDYGKKGEQALDNLVLSILGGLRRKDMTGTAVKKGLMETILGYLK